MWTELGEKPLLIDLRPDLYYETPHYAGYPVMLVRLDAIDDDELRERLIDGWLMKAPKRLIDAYAPKAIGEKPTTTSAQTPSDRLRRTEAAPPAGSNDSK